MLRTRSDLQLERDASARFLPWVLAVMVCLGALALAGALLLNRTAADWRQSVAGGLTAQVEGPDAADGAAEAARLLGETPGVAAARVLGRDEVGRLLQPWLGDGAVLDGLPLPALVDVRLAPGSAIDVAALKARLEAAVPGARLDAHETWLEGLTSLVRALQALAAAMVALVALATVVLVVFATRAGLAVHREVIEVLHLIGARDSYIARQFQAHTLRLALAGAVPGAVIAVGCLLLLGRAGAALEAPLLPRLSLAAGDWLALAALPLVAGILAMLTARVTVLGALKRML